MDIEESALVTDQERTQILTIPNSEWSSIINLLGDVDVVRVKKKRGEVYKI